MAKLHVAGSVFLPLLVGALSMGCSGSSGGSGGGVAVAGVSSGTPTAPPPATAPPPTSTPPPATSTPPTGSSTVPTTAEDRFYDPQVRSVLYTYCVSCHANSSNPAWAAYPLGGFPSDDASFNETMARIDLNNPEGSLILAKMRNATPHGGGPILNTSDVGYEYVLNWIRQGAVRDRFVGGPRTFTRNIQPILDRLCFGCHSGGTGGYTAGSNLTTNYNEMLSVTDANNPPQSLILRKNDGTLNHVGLAAFPVGSAERDVILQWIADGQRFNQ